LISFFRPLALVVAFSGLAACGSESDDASSGEENTPLLSAATLGEQAVLTVPEYLQQKKFADADAKNGNRQAQICKACHSLEERGPNMIGPALFGFFGRGVGGQAGFDYSPVMRNASFVWTPRALDAWLAQPGHFLPGNRMTFAGVMRQNDRDDLIAYLLDVTSTSTTE
jgi:cytochrome c